MQKENSIYTSQNANNKNHPKKEYQFLITTAHCKECGCDVGVKGILDYNAKEIDEQFRKAEGIISLEEIEKLGKIYNLGKAPLSIALGFGEVTITRYHCGTDSIKRTLRYYAGSIIGYRGNEKITGREQK